MSDGKAAPGGAAISVQYEAQPMDCALHPSEPVVAAALISGRLHAHRLGVAGGAAAPAFDLKAHRESARAVRFSPDGRLLVTASADQSILAVDAATGKACARKADAHATGIDRLLFVSDAVLASGDDDGNIQLWDTRQAGAVGGFAVHTDYITDMAHHAADKALLATSGDGTLSVNDLRTLKVRARSEDDAEEEFLSVAVLKGGRKVVAGASDGVLNIFSWGYWNDCSDRYPGHPSAVDCIVAINDDTIATGASDGIIRLMTVQPHRMLGVVGSHDGGSEGEPVQALAYCGRRQLLASAGLDDTVRLWDLAAESSEESDAPDADADAQDAAAEPEALANDTAGAAAAAQAAAADSGDDSDSDGGRKKKRKKRMSKGKGAHKISRGGSAKSSFFADL